MKILNRLKKHSEVKMLRIMRNIFNRLSIESLLRRVGIGKRFYIFFILISFIPIALIGFLTYFKSQVAVETKVTQYCKQINRGVRSNFDLRFQNINDFTVNLLYSSIMQDNLAQANALSEEGKNTSDVSKSIQDYLKENVILSRDTIIHTSLLTKYHVRVVYDIDSNNFLKASDNDIITPDLYRESESKGGKLLWKSVAKEDANNIFQRKNMDNAFEVSREFSIISQGNEKAGVFCILYSSQFLNDACMQNTGDGYVFLIDSDSTVVFSNEQKYLFKKFPYIKELANIEKSYKANDDVAISKIGGENIIMSYSKSNVNGWGIVYLMAYSPLVNDYQNFASKIFTILILLLALTVVFAFMFAQSISSPLKRMIAMTNKVKSGEFNVQVDDFGNDELSNLSNSLNDMAKRINELVDEVYKTKIREKDFKIKSLQAQINPHFIYNTLECIRWKARNNKDYDVSKRVETLSSLLRLVLSDNNTITILDNELKYIEYYLYFQKLSFKNALDVVWDVDDSVRKYKCIKLLLQPIVENCINHGFSPIIEKLIIKIVIKDKGDNIFICIEDNGVGADEEKVRKFIYESGENSVKHIALKNVYSRLTEYFGSNFSFEFYSRPDEGTRVEITFKKEC
jgi:two-component system, sensor histidine kinase YesM